MDKLTLDFRLEQETPNEIFRAFDDGEGLRLAINDGAHETTFPIGDADVVRLIKFLGYYLQRN